MRLGIIIPFYNRWDLTHPLLMRLYLHLPDWCDIYLVDDASTEQDVLGGISWWQKSTSRHKIFYIRNETNRGFGGSMNRGCKAAITKGNCDAVALLSNDVEVINDFATPIMEQLREKPNSLIGAELLWNDTGWNVLPNCMVVPYANGWFLACTAETWKDIGGFDPIYGKFDYEDVDLSLTAMMKGHEIVASSPYVKLHHIGGQTVRTYNPDRESHTKRNQQLFIEKWSKFDCKELRKIIYGE